MSRLQAHDLEPIRPEPIGVRRKGLFVVTGVDEVPPIRERLRQGGGLVDKAELLVVLKLGQQALDRIADDRQQLGVRVVGLDFVGRRRAFVVHHRGVAEVPIVLVEGKVAVIRLEGFGALFLGARLAEIVQLLGVRHEHVGVVVEQVVEPARTGLVHADNKEVDPVHGIERRDGQ
nr:hypothetical protein [Salinibacter sp.]